MEYPPIMGGGSRYTQDLISGLVGRELHTVLITCGVEDSVEKINDFLTIKRFKALNEIYTFKGELMKGISLLQNQIRLEAPDILHTIYFEESLIGQIVNTSFGIPHFITHTKNPMYKEDNPVNNPAWSLFNYINADKSTFFIAPSIAYKKCLIQSGVESNLVEVIYPGLNREVFRERADGESQSLRQKLKINKNEILILVSCVIRKRKGLDFIADAISKLSIPERKIKIIITGVPKSVEEENILSNFVKVVGQEKVITHGTFNDNEMPLLYNMADITLLCSEAEGLGISLLEAMGCGCPVIGTNVLGINEVIQDDKSGFLCNHGDTDKLNRSIVEIINNSVLRNNFISNSKMLLESKFSTVLQANKHIELYLNAVNFNEYFCTTVVYRLLNDNLEILVKENSDNDFSLPESKKNKNVLWQETAVDIVKKESGYEVEVPDYILSKDIIKKYPITRSDISKINSIVYAFEISNTTPKSDSSEKTSLWLRYDLAIDKVASINDKKSIETLHKLLQINN